MSFTISALLSAQDNMSSALHNVNTELHNMDTGGRQAGSGMSEMTQSVAGAASAIQGVIALAAGNQLVQWGMELVDLGGQVHAATATFEQLAGGEEAAQLMLEELRASTRGTADDMSLMQGANKMMLMGLADNAQEAARLTGIAVTLGTALGMDAAGAVDNFGAAIANMSYQRLDQLGISAAAVRERVNELKDAGYAVEDAFKMAVLEQGAAAMERLGDAAGASATGVAVLQTRWTNAMQAMGVATFDFVNRAATNFNSLSDQVGEIATIILDNRQQVVDELAAMDTGIKSDFTPTRDSAVDIGMEAAFFDAGHMQDIVGMNVDALNIALESVDVSGNIANMYGEAFNEQISAIQNTFDPAVFGNFGAMLGDVQLFTPEQADLLQQQADSMADVVTNAERLHDEGLITDEQLQGIRDAADGANDLADAAERGAAAFENMTLTQAFGQGGGGMAGEVSGDVLASMRAGGASEEELAAMQDTLDLASGRATEASIAYRDEVVPLLTEIGTQLGPEAVAEAISNLEASLQEAAFQGLSPEQIAENMAAMTGFEETPAGLKEVMDFDATELVTNISEAADTASNTTSDMDKAITQAQTLADALSGLPTEHRMTLTVDLMLTGDLPPEMLNAIVGGAITNAGGVAPASDPRNQPAPVNGGFSPTSYP